MRGFSKSSRRFLLQNLVLFLLMSAFGFAGVYASGRSAYRSANELGAMTSDYLNLQVNAFMGQYQQILEDAAYMVDAMLDQGAQAEEIQTWITSFSQQYDETMQYDESGLYGVIRGEGVWQWAPGPSVPPLRSSLFTFETGSPPPAFPAAPAGHAPWPQRRS